MGKNRIRNGLLCIAAVLLAVFLAAKSGEAVQTMRESRSEPTLVIDAGHGGFDGGAVGANGTSEQDINLSIARRVRELAEFFGAQTKMTRKDENALVYDPSRPIRENKAADIKAREQCANSVLNPVFISIHLNKFSDPQYHGAQVFYSPNHAGSRSLAEIMQETLISGCDPENHREAKQAESSIYLLKKLKCPAVIAECGFLSNPMEEKLLKETEYQKKLAVCIVYAYLNYEKNYNSQEEKNTET